METNLKTYCHRTDCKVLRTGFHQENYPVCSTCKEEISETLYNYKCEPGEGNSLQDRHNQLLKSVDKLIK